MNHLGGASLFRLLAYKEHKFHPILFKRQASGTVGATASGIMGKVKKKINPYLIGWQKPAWLMMKDSNLVHVQA